MYDLGDAVTLSTTVAVDGTPADATVTVAVTRPDGSALNAAPAVERSAVGSYRAVVIPDQAGTWRYVFTAAGAVRAVEHGTFTVQNADRPLPLATLADVEALHGRPLTAAERARAQVTLDAVTAQVRSWTRQQITRGTSTVTLPLDDDNTVSLAERPVRAVQAVTLDGTALTAAAWLLSGSTLHLARPWASAHNRAPLLAQVTYEHGHDPAPADVVNLVASRALRALQNPDGLRQYAVGSVSVTFAAEAVAEAGSTAWSVGEEALLGAYRRKRRRPGTVRLVSAGGAW